MLLAKELEQLTRRSAAKIGAGLAELLRDAHSSAEGLAERIWGNDFDKRVAWMRQRYSAPEGDPFGLDLDHATRALKFCALLHRHYFRTEVRGTLAMPQGRVLLVANHSGQIPTDAAIIVAACFLDVTPPRMVRTMVDKWTQTLPFVATLFPRVGQVVGVPENGRRLLRMGEAILAFPEGIRGISKPFSQRYQLEPFGRGFIRLAMETETPVVPVALVGAEEQYVSFGHLDRVARALGIPVFPLLPQVLLPGGQFPLPTKYRLHFGAPLEFAGNPDDDDLVEQRVGQVRTRIQSMLDEGLRQRRGLFF
ncbi:lysophospholipid acyltransferase family protein [Myxococcota bacterium]